MPRLDAIAQLDATLFALLLVISILGAVLAGAYPAWRACRIAPASQLKTQ